MCLEVGCSAVSLPNARTAVRRQRRSPQTARRLGTAAEASCFCLFGRRLISEFALCRWHDAYKRPLAHAVHGESAPGSESQRRLRGPTHTAQIHPSESQRRRRGPPMTATVSRPAEHAEERVHQSAYHCPCTGPQIPATVRPDEENDRERGKALILGRRQCIRKFRLDSVGRRRTESRTRTECVDLGSHARRMEADVSGRSPTSFKPVQE